VDNSGCTVQKIVWANTTCVARREGVLKYGDEEGAGVRRDAKGKNENARPLALGAPKTKSSQCGCNTPTKGTFCGTAAATGRRARSNTLRF
jgi:hypothetical protein